MYSGAVAQLGEHIVRNDEVGGSNPPSSTSPSTIQNGFSRVHINLHNVPISHLVR